MRRALTAVVASIALLVASSGPAAASVAMPPPPHEQAERATHVVVCTIESVDASRGRMVVAVENAIKGGAKGALDVTGIHVPSCIPIERPRSAFRPGERLILCLEKSPADAAAPWYQLDHMCSMPRIASDADLARETARWTELVRVAAMPDVADRRAAMVDLFSSPDGWLADAAGWFQFRELDTPAKCAPHEAGLVRAVVSAPTVDGLRGALRAIRGLTPDAAFARILELAGDKDPRIAEAAREAAGWYDRAEAVQALVAAGAYAQLGPSPRPEAYKAIREGVLGSDAQRRAPSLVGLARRFERFGADEFDLAMIAAALRREVLPAQTASFAYAIRAAGSVQAARLAVAALGEPDLSGPACEAACHGLYGLVHEARTPGTAEVLRAAEPLLVRLLEDGMNQYHLGYCLGLVHTPSARRALERVAKRNENADVSPNWADSGLRVWDLWEPR